MSRKTKAFSYDSNDHKYFESLKLEAKAHKPRVSESALLIHILRTHFEHKKMLKNMVTNG